MPLIMSKLNNQGRRDILVILDGNSMERIRNKDPFELNCWEMPHTESIGTISITYADMHEQEAIEQLVKDGKQDEAIKRAIAGWRFRPEMGDHDRGPEPIT